MAERVATIFCNSCQPKGLPIGEYPESDPRVTDLEADARKSVDDHIKQHLTKGTRKLNPQVTYTITPKE